MSRFVPKYWLNWQRVVIIFNEFCARGHSIAKNTGGRAGSIVWGLGFWLGKYILGFFKNVYLDNS